MQNWKKVTRTRKPVEQSLQVKHLQISAKIMIYEIEISE